MMNGNEIHLLDIFVVVICVCTTQKSTKPHSLKSLAIQWEFTKCKMEKKPFTNDSIQWWHGAYIVKVMSMQRQWCVSYITGQWSKCVLYVNVYTHAHFGHLISGILNIFTWPSCWYFCKRVSKKFCFFFFGVVAKANNWSASYWTDRIGWVGTSSDRSHQYHKIFDDNFLIPESLITFSTCWNGAIWSQSRCVFCRRQNHNIRTQAFILMHIHTQNEWKINFQLKKYSHFHFGLPLFSHQFQWTKKCHAKCRFRHPTKTKWKPLVWNEVWLENEAASHEKEKTTAKPNEQPRDRRKMNPIIFFYLVAQIFHRRFLWTAYKKMTVRCIRS